MGDQSTTRRARQSAERVLRQLRYVAQNTRDMIADLAEFERQLGLSIGELERVEEHVDSVDNQLVEPAIATVERRANLTDCGLVNDLMTQLQVAKALSISRTTLWKMRKEGRLPPQIQVSDRRVAYRRADVEAWIERGGNKASEASSAVE